MQIYKCIDFPFPSRQNNDLPNTNAMAVTPVAYEIPWAGTNELVIHPRFECRQ